MGNCSGEARPTRGSARCRNRKSHGGGAQKMCRQNHRQVRKHTAQIKPIRCDLQRDQDSCNSKSSHAIEQRKEPTKTAIHDAANKGRQM